jgi:hypothetical protein
MVSLTISTSAQEPIAHGVGPYKCSKPIARGVGSYKGFYTGNEGNRPQGGLIRNFWIIAIRSTSRDAFQAG